MSDAAPHEAQIPQQTVQQIIDHEHLRLLAIFYYVVGGMYALFSCFGLIYVALGVMFAVGLQFAPGEGAQGGAPPAVFGLVMAACGGLFVLAGWTFGGLTMLAGRSIQLRRRRVLTYVMAALNCLSFPFGLIMGICTFIVLSRASVSRLYDAAQQ